MKGNKFLNDYVKSCRKANREEEIEMYGKPLKIRHIQKSKKAYSRKKKFNNWDE